eukprot:GHUV01031410.1.p1 GENE.GHUV01031410.1~~GHUV01031410.1.p1  ORF type:complete len:113 (-),score=14.04 GHUV01031410.1:934-1224(-)
MASPATEYSPHKPVTLALLLHATLLAILRHQSNAGIYMHQTLIYTQVGAACLNLIVLQLVHDAWIERAEPQYRVARVRWRTMYAFKTGVEDPFAIH